MCQSVAPYATVHDVLDAAVNAMLFVVACRCAVDAGPQTCPPHVQLDLQHAAQLHPKKEAAAVTTLIVAHDCPAQLR